MDHEFVQGWSDINEGRIPVRIVKATKSAKPRITANRVADAGGSSVLANDQDVQRSKSGTSVTHITNITAPAQSTTSLYTSPEVIGSKHFPARATAVKPVFLQPEPVMAPGLNRNLPQSKPTVPNYGKIYPPSSNSQSIKHDQSGSPLFSGQNRYRSGPQPQNKTRGRRPYTNTSPSAQGSRTQSRFERNSFYRGSDVDGEGSTNRSVYISPNLYLSDPDALGLGPDGYEGPDGFLRDNDADRAERAGFEPEGKFPLIYMSFFSLPLRRHPEFDERFFGPRNTNLRHIAVKTNTHLSMQGEDDLPNIQIWGEPDDITLAKRDLHALMDHINFDIEENTIRVGGSWAKINAAPSDRKQARIDKIARDSAMRKRYRQAPEAGASFGAIGVFLWPSQEINPQTSLGMGFEALDNIRFECEVYIIFSRKRGMFRVLGSDPTNVEVAINRIFGAFCEIASKNRKPNKRFLVKPPSAELPGTAVRIVKKHNLEGRQITIKRLPQNVGVQVFLTGSPPTQRYLKEWQLKREVIERANYAYLKNVLQQGLNDVYYFRGYSALKIHFGTLLLFGYKKPTGGVFELKDFCQMMGDPQTAGEIVKFIGEEYIARAIIEECDSNTELFHPVDSKSYGLDTSFDGIDAYSSDNIPGDPPPALGVKAAPTIFATFKIKMYDDKGQTNDIRLEVKFELIPGDHPSDMANEIGELWKVGTRRWLHVRSTRNEKTRNALSRHSGPLDIKVFDLEKDISWQIELIAYQFYKDTDIYPIFAEFVRKLRIEEIPDESDPIGIPAEGEPDLRRTVKRINYVNFPGMTVETVIMKTKYQYWINGTPYLFEVTRYEHFDTEHVNRLYPDGIAISWKGVKTHHDTRWGACLINADVQDTLSKQQGLGIGCVGGWDPDVDAVFKSSGIGGFEHPAWTRDSSVRAHGKPDPWDGDGFKEMYHRIGECARLIARIRDEVLARDMEGAVPEVETRYPTFDE